MIAVITSNGHEYTLKSMVDGSFGFPTPDIRTASYDALFRATKPPRATYIFADLERLSSFELSAASQIYSYLIDSGIRCLNNPARAMTRVELLKNLHAEGINPFQVWRADELPRPMTFPVFIRAESDHAKPLSPLISDQAELEAQLEAIRSSGVALRGLIVIEYCAAPYAPDLWHKWGTFRIADNIVLDHIAVEANWLVKYGDYEKLNDEIVRDEYDAVVSNRFSKELTLAFEVAQIEFGRADHATIDGKSVIYEINTNPFIGPYVPDSKPVRFETQKYARQRLADALEAIDTISGGTLNVDAPRPLAWPRRP